MAAEGEGVHISTRIRGKQIIPEDDGQYALGIRRLLHKQQHLKPQRLSGRDVNIEL